jgi:O-antigen/teichoic acid export membrane protein
MVWQNAISLLRRFEVNRAVIYSVITQGWSAILGPATMLVIAWRLNQVEQGYYYTFSSILALQVFVELGLVTVIVQVASHEWAFLSRDTNGRISGDIRALSRLASLLRFAIKWYIVSGMLAFIGLSIGGYIFFHTKTESGVVWQWPWFALCGIASLSLMMSPVFSIIEGCNQVASIYSFRFVQGIANSLTIIVCILLGLGLFALAVAALVRFIFGLIFIAWKHLNFLQQLATCNINEQIKWKAEVWPFQWRIGISWLAGYFIFALFTPIMFYYHGAKVAGQMGMALTLVAAVEGLASAWINTRTPQFGMYIARKQYAELDSLFRRLLSVTMSIAGTCALGVFGLIYGLQVARSPFADRILPLLPFTILLSQKVLNLAVVAMAVYIRAHKSEPLMLQSLISAVLVGSSTWILGGYYGPTGAAIGFLSITLLWGIPSCYYVFQRQRLEYH